MVGCLLNDSIRVIVVEWGVTVRMPGFRMRALLSELPGPADSLVLRECAVPELRPGSVRIRVHACALNFPDVLVIEDRYQVRHARPFSPGFEIAGVIDAVAEPMGDLRVGMRVAAYVGIGGLAEMALAKAADVYPLSDSISFEVGSAILITYGTALHALLDRGQLREGETVMILGASGGVGDAALELARLLGACTVACVSSEEKAELVRKRGADRVLVYPPHIEAGSEKTLAGQFKNICPAGADVIFDPVGGAYAEAALRSIAWDGRYLVVGFAGGIPVWSGNLPLLKGCKIIGVLWGVDRERKPAHHARLIARVLGYCENGLLQPRIHAVEGLERAPRAIADLEARRTTGKMVVRI